MAELSVICENNNKCTRPKMETTTSENYYRTDFNFMGFRNFEKTQLGKYSANFNWEGAVKRPL